MILSVKEQVYVFLLCVSIGIFIGFIYDLFKILRKSIKHKDLFIQIEDLLYWIIVTFITFLVLLHRNNGEVRMYAVIGLIIGYVINETLISIGTVKLGVKFINYITIVIKQFIKLIIFPLKVIFKFLEKPLKFVNKKRKRKAYETKNMLKKNKNKLQFKVREIKRNINILKNKD